MARTWHAHDSASVPAGLEPAPIHLIGGAGTRRNRARPLEHQGGTLDAHGQLYDSPKDRAPRGRCVRMSRRSLLSREAGSLVAHTKVLRLLIENAGRMMPPEVGAALLTVAGWAVDLVAAEKKDLERRAADLEDSSILMAEIRSTLAILPDRKLEVILRDLPSGSRHDRVCVMLRC